MRTFQSSYYEGSELDINIMFIIVLYSRVIDVNSITSSTVTAINSSDFLSLTGPLITLTIPLELLKAFDDGDGIVRVISAIYRNVTNVYSYQIKERYVMTITN